MYRLRSLKKEEFLFTIMPSVSSLTSNLKAKIAMINPKKAEIWKLTAGLKFCVRKAPAIDPAKPPIERHDQDRV